MYSSFTALVTALLGIAVGISAQQLDPIKNMCTRFDHQSILKNNTIYIDGGIQTFRDVDSKGNVLGNVTIGYNENLITIDLSRSWDWKTNISEKVIAKTANPKTGSTSPNALVRGALYHGKDNDNKIYMWGGTTSYLNTSFPGWESPFVPTYSLWSYDIVDGTWGQYDLTLSVPHRPSSASSAEVPELGLAFYFNGELDRGSELGTDIGVNDKVFIPGMIVIDTQNQTARNLSTNAVVGDLPRTRGKMQYVPRLGKKGILVQIGGNQKRIGNFSDGGVGDLVPMDEIDLFDIASLDSQKTPDGVWYKQKASGTVIPAGRLDFCLFFAAASDNSSHNIYLYGGRGANNVFFDDMWVLSLPSFTWTKLYEGKSPRFGHTCHQVAERTLLTIGGIVDFNYSGNCDWEYKGIGVMDISTLTWGSVFDANPKPYEVPALVYKDIGGSGQGNATKIVPTVGYSSPALAALFHPQPEPKGKKVRSGIIAGAIVGALVLIGIIAAAIYLQRQRIHRFVNGEPYAAAEIGESSEVKEIMDHEVLRELDGQDNRFVHKGFFAGWREGKRGNHGKIAELDVNKNGRIGDERDNVAELDTGTGQRKSTGPIAELDADHDSKLALKLDAKRKILADVNDTAVSPPPPVAEVSDTEVSPPPPVVLKGAKKPPEHGMFF